MFVCTECGEVFEEPINWEETHGLDTPPYEQWSGCPVCRGCYVEASKCDCCNEYITTDTYVKTEGGERYCENCYMVMELGEENF